MAEKANPVPARVSLIDLQNLHEKGDTAPLDNLMRAWRDIKKMDPKDPRSFFSLGGYHGLPFRTEDPAWWGGYCHHGNILFPLWHRAYLKKLEESLQVFEPTVTLPYWDQTDKHSLTYGIPWALTDETYNLDGKVIPNPLRSYTLPIGVATKVKDSEVWSKPKGYETVRYPLSGKMTSEDKEKTIEHNNKYSDHKENVALLNQNFLNWLHNEDSEKLNLNEHLYFAKCLQAPNYTIFSNLNSVHEWNADPDNQYCWSLERPHNDMHVAIGGSTRGAPGSEYVEDAAGDMGENETSAFDPIFYFHHCNVDRVFWLWQKKHHQTKKLDLIKADPPYPGTKADDQPPVDTPLNSILDLDTPLYPFTRKDSHHKLVTYTSKDVIDIEHQLGYTYSAGSLEDVVIKPEKPLRRIVVEGINKTEISGSFVVIAELETPVGTIKLGRETVLNRWNPKHCKNCKVTALFKCVFPIPDWVKDLEECTPKLFIITPDGPIAPKKVSEKRDENQTIFEHILIPKKKKDSKKDDDKDNTLLKSSSPVQFKLISSFAVPKDFSEQSSH